MSQLQFIVVFLRENNEEEDRVDMMEEVIEADDLSEAEALLKKILQAGLFPEEWRVTSIGPMEISLKEAMNTEKGDGYSELIRRDPKTWDDKLLDAYVSKDLTFLHHMMVEDALVHDENLRRRCEERAIHQKKQEPTTPFPILRCYHFGSI